MKTIFIVGNWKSQKTSREASEWFAQFASYQPMYDTKKVILCPPFTLLAEVANLITKYNVPLIAGAQNISPFDVGAYTGEVNAQQVKEFASYTLIGHSERRREFKEEDTMLGEKVGLAVKYGLTPIYCIQEKEAFVPEGVTIVGYEPVWAIGTGKPETPENADNIAQMIKEKYPYVKYVLYGGSVTPENVATFTHLSHIDGVIPGGASLDPQKFFQLIKNA